MLVLAILRYEKPLEEVEKHTAAHRAYLKTLFDKGVLLASGPFQPRNGGLLLFRAETRDEVDLLLCDDPFLENGIARYEVTVWAPTLGAGRFDGQ